VAPTKSTANRSSRGAFKEVKGLQKAARPEHGERFFLRRFFKPYDDLAATTDGETRF